jgi:hypothetical protein
MDDRKIDKNQGAVKACPLHFFDSLSCVKANLWPGSKGVARKKHRLSYFGLRIFLVFFFNPHSAIGIPQFGGGPIGRPAGRPYMGRTLFLGKERLARPVQETRRASWFLRATPLLPGRAMPEIQFIFRPLGEKWGGKAVKVIFSLSPHTPDEKKALRVWRRAFS